MEGILHRVNENKFILTTLLNEKLDYPLNKKNCLEVFGFNKNIKELAAKDFERELGEGPTNDRLTNSMLKKAYMNGAEWAHSFTLGLSKKVEILQRKALDMETGTFEWVNVLDENGCLILKKLLYEKRNIRRSS